MKIVRRSRDVPDGCKGAAVAIGNFDGVHRGHQALIARAESLAREQNAPLGALVFEPHPQEFFRPDIECFRLTPFRTKARLLAERGVEILFALAFDVAMAGKSADAFVQDILVEGLQVGAIVVGADFRFGKGRIGDVELLKRLGKELGFAVEVFEPVLAGEAKISSSDIRAALKAGQPEKAAELLGHWWTIEGRVERGDGRGRALGFPTANLQLDGYLRPAFGVYAARAAVLKNERRVGIHPGVANIGSRPMFRVPEPLLEIHLFDFEGDLYGKHLAVEPIGYLRPEMSFASVEELKLQMMQDERAARAVLASRDLLSSAGSRLDGAES